MNIQIKKRNTVQINILLFLLFSPLFLFVLASISSGQSCFDKTWPISFFKNFRPLIFLCASTFLSVFFVRKVAKYVYPFYICWVLVFSLQMFFLEFDKFLLGLNFIFLVCSFFFYLLLLNELNEPIFNPKFFANEIFNDRNTPLEVLIYDMNGKSIVGGITNWNSDSFFVKIRKGDGQPSGQVRLEINHFGRVFKDTAWVYTKYGEIGLGLKVERPRQRTNLLKRGNFERLLTWKAFCDIITQRGYKSMS